MARLAETALELAYVGLEVSDPPSINRILGDVAGLMQGADTADGAISWRDDDRVHRVMVREGPANDADFLGFEFESGALDRAVERLTAMGVEVTPGTAAQAAARRVDRLFNLTAPWGMAIELVTGLAAAETPLDTPLMPGGFKTKGMGFGHVAVQMATAVELAEGHRFLVEGLGFRQSDWFEGSIGPIDVVVNFYHCNPRHHTIAIGYSPAGCPPNRLNHVLFETVDQDNVGNALDRARGAGIPIDQGLGKHDNDRMFSFYVASPSGIRVEVGFGGREVTEAWDDNRHYDRPSLWGHMPEPSRA